jgi:ferrous iron transport protein B
MAAREVMVSSLATVYAVAAANDGAAGDALRGMIAQDWSVATGIALLVWFIYAPQCISTLATIRRETHSWKQTAFATGYLFGLAYLAAFVAYRLAVAAGLG